VLSFELSTFFLLTFDFYLLSGSVWFEILMFNTRDGGDLE